MPAVSSLSACIFRLRYFIGEDSLPWPATEGSYDFLQAVDASLQPKSKRSRSTSRRGQGPGRPRTRPVSAPSGRGPGRPPLSREGLGNSTTQETQKRRGRPPLNGARVMNKGLDRSRKVSGPAICHLCHLGIDEDDQLEYCRTCGVLVHMNCEKATGEDCGSF
jgi:hypothetical protein